MHPKNQDPSPSVSAPPRHPQRPGIFCPVTVAVASPPGSDPHPEHPCCLGRGVHPPHPVLGRQVSTFSDFQPYLRQLVEHLQAMGSLRDAVVIEQVGMGTRASWAGQCRHAPALGHLLLLPGLPHPCRPWPLCACCPSSPSILALSTQEGVSTSSRRAEGLPHRPAPNSALWGRTSCVSRFPSGAWALRAPCCHVGLPAASLWVRAPFPGPHAGPEQRPLQPLAHLPLQSCSLNEPGSSLFNLFLHLVRSHVIRIGGR